MRHSFAFSEMHTEVFKGKMQNVCYLLDYILAKKKKKQMKQVGKILTTGKFRWFAYDPLCYFLEISLNKKSREFPGGPVVRHFHCGVVSPG